MAKQFGTFGKKIKKNLGRLARTGSFRDSSASRKLRGKQQQQQQHQQQQQQIGTGMWDGITSLILFDQLASVDCMCFIQRLLHRRVGLHPGRVPAHGAVVAVPERDGGELPGGGAAPLRGGGGGAPQGEGRAGRGGGEEEEGNLPQRRLPRVHQQR